MCNELTIVTNNVARNTIYGYELTPKEREEFDYYTPGELNEQSFVRYRKQVYDIGEFVRVESTDSPLSNWHGYANETMFSGVCIKFVDNSDEQVIMGRYYSK